MSNEQSPQGEIVERLSRIAGSISHIGKDQKNQSQGFKFRGVDQVLNAIHEPFSKEGVVLLPEVLKHDIYERATRSGGIQYHHVLSVRFTFTASDGSSISCVMPGEAMDSGDKGASKAMSIALKQAMFQVMTLPVEEQSIEDPDRHTPEESTPTMASEQAKHEIENLFDRIQIFPGEEDIAKNALNHYGVKSVNELTAKVAATLINKLKTKINKLNE